MIIGGMVLEGADGRTVETLLAHCSA